MSFWLCTPSDLLCQTDQLQKPEHKACAHSVQLLRDTERRRKLLTGLGVENTSWFHWFGSQKNQQKAVRQTKTANLAPEYEKLDTRKEKEKEVEEGRGPRKEFGFGSCRASGYFIVQVYKSQHYFTTENRCPFMMPKRPRKESATNAPNRGSNDAAPPHALTFAAAEAVDCPKGPVK
ncbi:hypothetical protein PanWU01x14_356110 [Parasponia andersonii]|uniref:Uncharacterized protein n=1 Tax=Parasponia andersonii TaxID=3476 RepID=A0A2P5A932_PARAD|nr:hypothetical protein PanWU01x14_356110 [Parasponia andersonii]